MHCKCCGPLQALKGVSGPAMAYGGGSHRIVVFSWHVSVAGGWAGLGQVIGCR